VKVLTLCRVIRWQKREIAATLLFVLMSSSLYCQNEAAVRSTLDNLPAKIKSLRPSVVEILVDGKRSGSGFIVSKSGHIMTATHVVGKPYMTPQQTLTVNYFSNIEVVFSDGTKLPAQPVTTFENVAALYDSAILKVNRATPHNLILSKTPHEDGSMVLMMGFPLDLPRTTNTKKDDSGPGSNRQRTFRVRLSGL
jgi:S1-C subfamily serine protease